jgi:hypothetical protein
MLMPDADNASREEELTNPFGPDWKRPWHKRLGSRLVLWRYSLWHPERPKLAPGAVDRIVGLLPACRTGLEWGSGRSTLWLADRLDRLTSVENSARWHDWVTTRLARRSADHAVCLLRNPRIKPYEKSPYVRVAEQFENESLDFCLIDGRARVHCANAVVPKMAPGGVLVLDDAQRYLRPEPRGDGIGLARQPNVVEGWDAFLAKLSGWPCEWFPSPARSTVLWIRPSQE